MVPGEPFEDFRRGGRDGVAGVPVDKPSRPATESCHQRVSAAEVQRCRLDSNVLRNRMPSALALQMVSCTGSLLSKKCRPQMLHGTRTMSSASSDGETKVLPRLAEAPSKPPRRGIPVRNPVDGISKGLLRGIAGVASTAAKWPRKPQPLPDPCRGGGVDGAEVEAAVEPVRPPRNSAMILSCGLGARAPASPCLAPALQPLRSDSRLQQGDAFQAGTLSGTAVILCSAYDEGGGNAGDSHGS